MRAVPDWEALLRFVRSMAMVDDLDQFGPVVLAELAGLIPSELASFNEVDPIGHRAAVVAHPRPISVAEAQAWQRWSHQNPSLMHMLRTGDGSLRRISDFLTTAEFHRLELYEYVYAPLGIEYQMAVALPAPRPIVIGIALNRSSTDFTEDEMASLDALRPHLVQAYRHAQLLSERRRALDTVAGALCQEGRGFHVLGESLEGPTRSLLARYFPDIGAALPPPVRSWAALEHDAFHKSDASRLREPFVCRRQGHRLTIRYVPSGRGPDLLWLDERVIEGDASSLQRLGLTCREAEVLWQLAQGRSTKELARHLNLSVGTVKKHLEHVYRRLGVSTGTAAVAQAIDALHSADRPVDAR